MFDYESWKSIYFGVKKSKVKVKSHKNIAGVGLFTLVSAGFSSFYFKFNHRSRFPMAIWNTHAV